MDLTVVTYGIGVQWALEEAVYQESRGRSLEIVDLRTLIPWDRDCVLTSVAKTNRVLVLHEAAITGGFGAELCASIAQEAFQYLDAPPVRVASEDTPIPFSTSLEKDLYSPLSRLRPAVEALLVY
jgi:2-oxoisovalerate dehydrogenase E1 component